jgi:tRNA (guanine-N7-)-methyltransferase
MSRSGQLSISRTRDIKRPNEYILALNGEFSEWTFDEERAPECKGKWREILKISADAPVDVELGTGNGYHFAHQAVSHPERGLVGFELKYKPLIQSIRRAVRGGAVHARAVRYNAAMITDIFAQQEVDNIFIHFPDPWEKLRSHKHRMIQDEFLKRLHFVQKPGGRIEFKTDSREYFDWAMERFERSPYKIAGHSYDLHNSEFASRNFMTHFEKLFTRQGLPTHFAELLKS